MAPPPPALTVGGLVLSVVGNILQHHRGGPVLVADSCGHGSVVAQDCGRCASALEDHIASEHRLQSGVVVSVAGIVLVAATWRTARRSVEPRVRARFEEPESRTPFLTPPLEGKRGPLSVSSHSSEVTDDTTASITAADLSVYVPRRRRKDL